MYGGQNSKKSGDFPLSGSEEGCFWHHQDRMVSPNPGTHRVYLKLMSKMSDTFSIALGSAHTVPNTTLKVLSTNYARS